MRRSTTARATISSPGLTGAVKRSVWRQVDAPRPRQAGADDRRDQCCGAHAVHDSPAEARAFGEVVVEVERVGVAGEIGEEAHLLIADNAAEIGAHADRQILEIVTGPGIARGRDGRLLHDRISSIRRCRRADCAAQQSGCKARAKGRSPRPFTRGCGRPVRRRGRAVYVALRQGTAALAVGAARDGRRTDGQVSDGAHTDDRRGPGYRRRLRHDDHR